MNNVMQLFDSGWYTVKYCSLQSDPLTDQINLAGCLQERPCHLLVDASCVVLSTVCYPALAAIVILGELALFLDLYMLSKRKMWLEKQIAQIETEDVTQAHAARKGALKKQIEQLWKQLEAIKLEVKLGIHALPKDQAIRYYYDENKNSKKWSKRRAAHNNLSTLRAWEKATLEWCKLHETGDPYKRLRISEMKLSLVKMEMQRQIHTHHMKSITRLLIPVVGLSLWLHAGKTIQDELEADLVDDYNQKISRSLWLPRY